MQYITSEQMKTEEQLAITNGITIETMMENAGKGVATEIAEAYGPLEGKRIVVIIGKGNNGGDGSVAARYLSLTGANVGIILLAKPDEIRTAEAAHNWNKLESLGVNRYICPDTNALRQYADYIKSAEIIVAAIFGTGIRGDIREPEASAIRAINESKAAKVAIDIPSGIDPDTGEIKDPAVKADLTVTLHRPKIGLKNRKEITGRVVVVQIGI